MDINTLGIPNIRVRNIGTRRDPLEMVEAIVKLDAWDGYLTKRYDNGRVIEDGTVLVHFACNTRTTREDAGWRRLWDRDDAPR